MTNLIFNQTLALSLYQSAEEFPIDLDDAWQWLGYSRKDKCLEAIQVNLMPGLDFSTSRGKSTGGRPKQEIRISIEGIKNLGMMAGTPQGKAIRKTGSYAAIATSQPQLPPIQGSKAKGKPENFDNPPSKELTDQLSFRVTKEMKEEVKAQDDPPEFCREAIQEKLDRSKEK